MIEYIFSLLAPHRCINCRLEGLLLCRDCQEMLPPPLSRCYACTRETRQYICSTCRGRTALDGLIIGTVYEDVAKKLIHSLKFERAAAARTVIASVIVQRFDRPIGNAVVSYIPTAAKRMRVRGYDQSELIAKELAKMLALPFQPTLQRIGSTRQLGADKQQRMQQMEAAFVPRQMRSAPRQIILIDDVITTGASMEAAARVLKQAGVERVTGVAFAAA